MVGKRGDKSLSRRNVQGRGAAREGGGPSDTQTAERGSRHTVDIGGRGENLASIRGGDPGAKRGAELVYGGVVLR
jgi:hypothetical protein